MTEQNQDKPQDDTPPQEAAAAETAAAAQDAPADDNGADDPNKEPTIEDAIDALLKEKEELLGEIADMKDQNLRLVAEMENTRRRALRDKVDAEKFAVTKFARDILAVADNLDRALLHVSADQREAADDVTKGVIEGIEMTQKELVSTFEKHSLTRIDAMGKKFDPNLHNAMFEAPMPDQPDGSVFQVVTDGWMIGDRLLRPAQVGVARGGPAFEEAAPAEQAETPTEPAEDNGK